MIDPKPRPNHDRYIQVLRAMTPEQRLLKSFELYDLGKELMRAGIRQRNPGMSEEEINQMLVKGLSKCHNRNY